jgi:1,4-dihydroxy-2-naphthoate octaprenyltransferase
VAQYLKLARLQFVAGGFLIFIFGALLSILAGAPFSLARLLLGYLVVFPAHLSVSFSNDYFDAAVDASGTPNFFSGGSGVLVLQPALRRMARIIAVLLMCISITAGFAYVIIFALPFWFLLLVVAGNLVGWFYSAPPLQFSYHSLGELSAGFTVGFLVPVSGYVAAGGSIDLAWWPLWTILFLYSTAFIVAVAIPDVEADRIGRKLTWAVRFGRKFAYAAVGILFSSASLLLWLADSLVSARLTFSVTCLAYASLLPVAVWLVMVSRVPKTQPQHTAAVRWMITSTIAFLVFANACLLMQAFQTSEVFSLFS